MLTMFEMLGDSNDMTTMTTISMSTTPNHAAIPTASEHMTDIMHVRKINGKLIVVIIFLAILAIVAIGGFILYKLKSNKAKMKDRPSEDESENPLIDESPAAIPDGQGSSSPTDGNNLILAKQIWLLFTPYFVFFLKTNIIVCAHPNIDTVHYTFMYDLEGTAGLINDPEHRFKNPKQGTLLGHFNSLRECSDACINDLKCRAFSYGNFGRIDDKDKNQRVCWGIYNKADIGKKKVPDYITGVRMGP